MTLRYIALATALCAVVACRDVTRSIDPTRDVTEDTVTVFPLRGSPLTAPSALDLFTPRTVRVGEASWRDAPYELVVDTASGAALLYPSQFITTEASNTAMLEVTTPFDSIPEAPTGGYQDSTAVSLTPGETIIVRGRNFCAGGFPGRDVFYAKVQFLELGSSSGFSAARFRIRTNPNCGFRSFADGLPAF